MRLLPFLFGTGWSMVWYALFYLCVAVPAAVFLGELRRPRKARERAFAFYALGMLSLTVFTLIHALLLAVRWHVPPMVRTCGILAGVFVIATVAWTIIPQAMVRRTRMRVAWVHALVVLLFGVNLCSLWVVRNGAMLAPALP